MKKVCILGGTGFIGYNLARYIAENRNYLVTIADNFFRGQMDTYVKDLIYKYNVKLIKGDFTDPAAFRLLQNDYDYFYMLASVVGVNNTLEIPHEIIRINSLLILNTLDWLKTAKVKKVLFTSTSECYAGTIEKFGYMIPTPEEIPLCINEIGHPRYTYAVTKMLGESGFLNYAKVFGFRCSIIRYHNVFGPRMGFKHVIPHLVQRFLNGENPFKVYGADQTRSFCYISDAVAGTVLAMEKELPENEIFHIGTGDEITIRQLIYSTGELMGFKGVYEDAPTYPGSVSRRCPDISKAKNLLGFKPTVSWVDGLRETVNWYRNFFASRQTIFEKGFEKPGHEHV